TILSIIVIGFTIFFGAIVFACIGLCIAARTDMTNSFLWNNVINMPLVFISGAIIPIDSFGQKAQVALLLNPTTWMADAIRVFLGGQIGDAGTGNLFFGGNVLLGYLLDLFIISLWGIMLFYLAFRVFGGSLQESSGGFAGMIYKKTADAREKWFKDLNPEDREIMMNITSKIDMLKIGQIMGLAAEGKQDQAVKMLKDAGVTDGEIQEFFAAGMRMMQQMMKKQKKGK
ncbi:MAG: ABC transporter permease, partial [Promethearchaeota archaeon]